ncbi:hypothetical protein CDN99_07765 [Roseateles aquatilis]|uniref:Uncharacterized protein n=2 Tax=Roseateles aquatilis TaxID=431061 RepID=A0A246JHW6_9BURK|nr:hypothetical protein CDN99_07765 [Roseateles aquatilis]
MLDALGLDDRLIRAPYHANRETFPGNVFVTGRGPHCFVDSSFTRCLAVKNADLELFGCTFSGGAQPSAIRTESTHARLVHCVVAGSVQCDRGRLDLEGSRISGNVLARGLDLRLTSATIHGTLDSDELGLSIGPGSRVECLVMRLPAGAPPGAAQSVRLDFGASVGACHFESSRFRVVQVNSRGHLVTVASSDVPDPPSGRTSST